MSSRPDYSLLSAADRARVEQAIAAAEEYTTAELKVVVARHCWEDPRRKAARLFHELGLADIEHQNGVLILVVLADRELVIHGDEGIHQHVGQAFWDEQRDLMIGHFRRGAYGDGLVAAIERVGERLARHYPAVPGNPDEVSNEVIDAS